jgi:hypothetical protein
MLEAEYSGQRFVGVIEDVERGEGYAWLRIDGLNETIRLERRKFCSPLTLAQFDRIKGRQISVLLTDSKILNAQRQGRRVSYNAFDSRRSLAHRAIFLDDART